MCVGLADVLEDYTSEQESDDDFATASISKENTEQDDVRSSSHRKEDKGIFS
jgi:hypothetical protein